MYSSGLEGYTDAGIDILTLRFVRCGRTLTNVLSLTSRRVRPGDHYTDQAGQDDH
jgi:hypothetical protein